MAEYSSEYCELRNFKFGYDFRVADIFDSLTDGEVFDVICEGFGFHEITPPTPLYPNSES